MSFLTLVRRLRTLRHRDRVESDLDRELRFHLEMETARHVRGGLSPAAARLEALRAFGGVIQTKEDVRASWGARQLDAFAQDIRAGWRSLRRTPGYVAAVVGVFAVGIGAASASFSMIYGVLLRPLPYANSSSIVELRQFNDLGRADQMRFSPLEIADYRARTSSFGNIAEYHSMWFNVIGGPEPERLQVGVVSPEYFGVLGVRPILGRLFTSADDRLDSAPVLLLTEPYWRRAFGGDPAVIGRTLSLNDKAHRVIGILPSLPAYPNANDVFMPTMACPFRRTAELSQRRDARMSVLFATLRPGVSVDAARSDIADVARQMAAANAAAYAREGGFSATLSPLAATLAAPTQPLVLLFGIVLAVLAIVCANVGSLTLARLLRREHDIDMRVKLGASRGRLVRQFVTESVLLSVAGGSIGFTGMALCESIVRTAAARFSPRAFEIGLHPAVIAFAVGAALAAGVVSGLASSLMLGPAGAAPAASRRRRGFHTREVLVCAQVGLTVVLLLTAGVMLRSLARLEDVDPGFGSHDVLTMRVSLDWTKYDESRRLAQIGAYLENVQKIPGVTMAAFSGSLPIDDVWRNEITTPGPAGHQRTPILEADQRIVSADYFRLLDVPIVAGRVFNAGDTTDSPAVAVVSEKMARTIWGARDVVGQRFMAGDFTLIVCGIASDVRQRVDQDSHEEFYVSMAQAGAPLEPRLLVRGPGDPHAFATLAIRAIHSVDSDQPVVEVRTLTELRLVVLAPRRLMSWLLGSCGAAALLIALTGIGGLVAFVVSHRTREFGIRLALGASPRGLMQLIIRSGFAPVAVGLATGLVAAWIIVPLISEDLYATSPTDPFVFLVGTTLLALTSLLACFIPARRAAMTDPLRAIKE